MGRMKLAVRLVASWYCAEARLAMASPRVELDFSSRWRRDGRRSLGAAVVEEGWSTRLPLEVELRRLEDDGGLSRIMVMPFLWWSVVMQWRKKRRVRFWQNIFYEPGRTTVSEMQIGLPKLTVWAVCEPRSIAKQVNCTKDEPGNECMTRLRWRELSRSGEMSGPLSRSYSGTEQIINNLHT